MDLFQEKRNVFCQNCDTASQAISWQKEKGDSRSFPRSCASTPIRATPLIPHLRSARHLLPQNPRLTERVQVGDDVMGLSFTRALCGSYSSAQQQVSSFRHAETKESPANTSLFLAR